MGARIFLSRETLINYSSIRISWKKKRVIRIFDMNNRKKMQKKLFDRTRYSIDQADVKSKSYVDFSISNNQYTNLDRS